MVWVIGEGTFSATSRTCIPYLDRTACDLSYCAKDCNNSSNKPSMTLEIDLDGLILT